MDVFELQAKLGLDSSEYESGLSKAGKALGNIAKVGAAAVGVAAAGLTAITKMSVSSYAEYEQLVGGMDKLYGESSSKIQEYASNAFSTAQMSANDYMQMATSFSASLINSLGGDTAMAADYANKAITDMSDNASIFGTDMESVQNAYRGFARGNFSMLDNLSLGYAGTKQGMEELLEKAEELQEAQGNYVDYSIDSYADIVDAIHVVQEDMQIAGNTQREAMRTIEGTFNMTKSAWNNLLVAFSKGEGVSEAIDNLILSVFGDEEGTGLLNQIIPRVETVMESIGEFISKAGPFFSEQLPALIESIVPSVLTSAATLVSALSKGIISSMPTLLDTGFTLLYQFLDNIINNADVMVLGAFEMVLTLANGISENLPTLIPKAVEAVIALLKAFVENAPLLGEAGYQLLRALAEGIVNALPSLGSFLKDGIIALFGQSVEEVQWGVGEMSGVVIDEFDSMSVSVNNSAESMANEIVQHYNDMSDGTEEVLHNVGTFTGMTMEEIRASANSSASGISEDVVAKWQSMQDGTYSAWSGMSSDIDSTLSTISSTASSKVSTASASTLKQWESMRSSTDGSFTKLSSTVSNQMNRLNKSMNNASRTAVQSFMNNLSQLPSKANTVISNVVSAVQNMVSRLKSAMNFSWSLPHLKLPHVNISGRFSLEPASAPSFSVSWYARAMRGGMILNSPTIFGMGADGTLLGGGEAGSEVVVGTNSLMSMIKTSVNEANSQDRVYALLEYYLPKLARLGVYLDGKALVGELSDTIENDLSKKISRREEVFA